MLKYGVELICQVQDQLTCEGAYEGRVDFTSVRVKLISTKNHSWDVENYQIG